MILNEYWVFFHSGTIIMSSFLSNFLQVSANTAALNRSFQRLKMSSTMDSNSGSLGELTDGTFETVADALHLQNSVIGMVYWYSFIIYRILRTIGRYFFFSTCWLRPIVHIDLYKDEVKKIWNP